MAEDSPFLIVGLGNPGQGYEFTPHNLGFMVVDELARRLSTSFARKGKSLKAEGNVDGRKVLLLKPQTYMNLSGEAVREASDFFKIDTTSSLLVLTDEMDIPLGQVRIRLSGGSGGHNGMKSIIQHLGTEAFPRLRLGIGREEGVSGEKYLLRPMTKGRREGCKEMVETAVEATLDSVKNGILHAMNTFNKREKKNEP